MGEELAKLTEELLKNGKKPEELAGAYASSSSAPPEPNHRPTNVAQAPELNPAYSTADSNPLMEPSSSASEPLGPELMDESGSKYWPSTSLGDLLPKLKPPKDVGLAYVSQVEHGQQPNAGPSGPGPSNTGPSNSRPVTTKPVSKSESSVLHSTQTWTLVWCPHRQTRNVL